VVRGRVTALQGKQHQLRRSLPFTVRWLRPVWFRSIPPAPTERGQRRGSKSEAPPLTHGRREQPTTLGWGEQPITLGRNATQGGGSRR
jgi:hypothetical protein